jgi:hypothetical protein
MTCFSRLMVPVEVRQLLPTFFLKIHIILSAVNGLQN